MKVAYLNPTGMIGGAERILLDVIAAVGEHQRSTGQTWQPELILGSDGPLVAVARERGVSTRVVPCPPTWLP